MVVHAEHFSAHSTDGTHILWNNYYEYQFENAKYIDFFITATDLQNKILTQQFEIYTDDSPRIRTIPVGSLKMLNNPQESRKPYSIMIASRLVNEKHVDWIALAVIKSKQRLPQLNFDIYSDGPEQERIERVIKEHQAEDYIHLKGYVNLQNIYKKYELFMTASQSEGFGLTLKEAIGSGLGMIGFNVNYGSPTFIRHNQNGYLVPIDLDNQSIEEVTTEMAEKIVRYFEEGPKQPHEVSYEIAESFITPRIVDKWKQLIEEVLHD